MAVYKFHIGPIYKKELSEPLGTTGVSETSSSRGGSGNGFDSCRQLKPEKARAPFLSLSLSD